MAGDWIKMRTALAEDPAVISIASKLDMEEFAVVGRLHQLWSWADHQSRDGHASGVTQKWVDRYLERDGFAAALVEVGWLIIDDTGITLPNFDRHNGETAKTRALGSKRKQKERGNVTQEHGQMSRSDRDKSVTREEKRREEIVVQDSVTVVPIRPEQQPSDLTDHNESDFARAVAGVYAKVWSLDNPPPVGMVLGNTVCMRARSYAPATSLDWWELYFERCLADGFLNGTKNPKFCADFGYLISEKTFAGVINASQLEAAHG